MKFDEYETIYVIKMSDGRYILSKNFTVENVEVAHYFGNYANAKDYARQNLSDLEYEIVEINRKKQNEDEDF